MEGTSFAAGDSWPGYRDALLRLYQEGEPVPDEELLDAFYERAQQLSEDFRAQLSAGYGDLARLEWGVLAVAALEVAVAGDVYLAELAQRREVSLGWEGGDLEGEPLPAGEEVGSLLREARIAFGDEFGMPGGAAVDPSPAEIRADRGIDELLDSCVGPASSFAHGALLAEVNTLLASLQLFDDIGELSFGSHRFRIGSGLVVTALEKLCALIRGSLPGQLVSRLRALHLGPMLDISLSHLTRGIAAGVVRTNHAKLQVTVALRGRALDAAREEELDTGLTSLCLDYERKMHTAARLAKGVRRIGPLVVLLGGVGPGRVVVAAVNGAGFAYTLYSCADRLDTAPGRTPGVPSLVRQAIA